VKFFRVSSDYLLQMIALIRGFLRYKTIDLAHNIIFHLK